VLSAWALWSIKPLRILAVIVAVLVVISTVTTGWHYLADVIAGLIISAASGLIANQIIGKDRAPLNTPPAGVA
jgi:membrane-associated phospholipid phosphatase